MSDGNFNRSLLPHTPYQSGMKAGKQIAKMKAVELYKARLRELLPDCDEDTVRQESQLFEHLLSEQIK